MPGSPDIAALRARVAEIESAFLPTVADVASGDPLSRHKLRAYLMLAHAELEDYVEDMLLSLVDSELAAWKATTKSSRVLTALVGYHPIAWPPPITILSADNAAAKNHAVWINRDVDCRIKNAVRQYQSVVENNNGIKQKDLLALLMPVGMMMTDLDPLFLAECEAMGDARGKHAHSSAQAVTELPNPDDTKARVLRIVEGLDVLQQRLQSLIPACCRSTARQQQESISGGDSGSGASC